MCGISLFFYIAQSKEWWSWQLTNISTPAICIGVWSDRLWFNTLIISWWYLEKMNKLGLFSPFQGDYSSELYLCIFLIQPFWWITENLKKISCRNKLWHFVWRRIHIYQYVFLYDFISEKSRIQNFLRIFFSRKC